MEGHTPQQWNVEWSCEPGPSVAREEGLGQAATSTRITAHVLDDPEYTSSGLERGAESTLDRPA